VFRSTELAEAHLFVLPLDRSSGPKPLFPGSKSTEGNADISSDGQWIAYDSNESGAMEVYVRPFPDVETGKWQISSGGGRKPAWSRSGREVYFETPPQTGTPQLMTVAVQPGHAFISGKPQPVFSLRKYAFGAIGRAYDVAPDGRFLEERRESGDVSTPQTLRVIVNWFDDVRARVK
jgi:Periplasmic component of the Tol biopolymer transport system